MKNVYRVSTKQYGDMKPSVLRSKNATILQAQCVLLEHVKFQLSPHRHVSAISLHVFVDATVKLQKFVISEPNFSDRPRQPAYEIFSIKRKFQQSKSRPLRFKKAGAGGRQRQLPPKKWLFYRNYLV